jgi:hypothetical protein
MKKLPFVFLFVIIHLNSRSGVPSDVNVNRNKYHSARAERL